MCFQDYLMIDDSNETPPPRNIMVTNYKGQEAIIDFSGDSVIYSGDLPIDESAKIFFEAVRRCWGIMITIKIIEKDKLYPKFGQALRNPDTILVRKDLPRWARLSTIVHELYHLEDNTESQVWREVRAILVQLFIPFIGGLMSIGLTIIDKKRMLFYYKKYIKKGDCDS